MRPVLSFLLVLPVICLMWTVGCQKPTIPAAFTISRQKAALYPDYSDTVLPVNIAPLNFEIQEPGDEFCTVLTGGTDQIIVAGRSVQFPLPLWKQLLANNQGRTINIDIYIATHLHSGKTSWTKFPTIVNTISKDPVDSWLTYRKIEPGYEFYSDIALYQRNMETFDEKILVYAPRIGKQTCVNCHSFQNHRTDSWMYHVRVVEEGTVLTHHGTTSKRKFPTGRQGESCAYPAWHPTLPLIAFSENSTFQMFHERDLNKVEVMDIYSTLKIYNVETDQLIPLESVETPNSWETFPHWAPDGQSLYYCSANFEYKNTNAKQNPRVERGLRHKEVKYSICRRKFDQQTQTFGQEETVIDAKENGKSAVHPRLSPDGRFLVYTLFDYGTFPIWHRESDLWMKDLQTGETRALQEVNSNETESWHNFDSSGRWLILSTRREDGLFTQLYLSHFDPNGKLSKPLALPQKKPVESLQKLKSYNIPEFTVEPVRNTPNGNTVRK